MKTFPPPRAVPDLMEAFRKSLAAVQAEIANDDGKPAKAARPKKPKAKVEGQREMLLPIAGGKAEAEAKPAKAPRRKAADQSTPRLSRHKFPGDDILTAAELGSPRRGWARENPIYLAGAGKDTDQRV